MKKPRLLTLGDSEKKILRKWTRLEVLSEVAAVDAAEKLEQRQRAATGEEISTSAADDDMMMLSHQKKKENRQRKI